MRHLPEPNPKHRREDKEGQRSRRKLKMQKVKMMSTDSIKLNWLQWSSVEALRTWRGFLGLCRKCTRVTAKNRNTRCLYPWVIMGCDHWFAVYAQQSSYKRLFTPKRTKGLDLKAAEFTLLSMHLPHVRGLQTLLELFYIDQWFSDWLV